MAAQVALGEVEVTDVEEVIAGAGLLPEESRFQAGAAGSREIPRRRTAAAAWIPNLDS